MNKADVGTLFDKIASYYPSFRAMQSADVRSVLADWHNVLQETSLTDAIKLLEDYASEAEHKYAPHPGALKMVRTDSDRYHDYMRDSGEQTLSKLDEFRQQAVGPTEEQRRKVRAIVGKSI